MKEISVYEIVTHRIIALLEKGCIPWSRPWLAETQAPQNLVSRHPYRGINVFLLNAMAYSSQFWVTYRQAEVLGGHVRRGEKACPVVFWKWLDLQDKPTGETERVPLLRYYSLFNVAQCDGIPADRIPAEDSKREHNPIARAESIVATMPKRPEIRHGLNQAFYSPAQDFVGMPAPEQFKTAEAYYCCVFHELTHSTGHETRLNRKGVSGTDGQWSAFGSDPYAKEELVATMGEAYLCAKAGIIKRTITNSASYISGWLERLRKDNRLIIQAAAQAQHAADYILNRKAIVPEEPAEAHN